MLLQLFYNCVFSDWMPAGGQSEERAVACIASSVCIRNIYIEDIALEGVQVLNIEIVKLLDDTFIIFEVEIK